MTWPELDTHLAQGACVMLPTGSTEQHGPMGLVGTDTICAHQIALAAAKLCNGIVAPPVAYTPAPFNTGFPGTVSITPTLLQELVFQIGNGLLSQGFLGVFVVNGHGANLAPVQAAAADLPEGAMHIQSWWDPDPVADLRASLFGDWEGMHATPSEVAVTQVFHGCKPIGEAAKPPKKLSAAYIAAHSGDRHGPPDEHRAEFPDGRVGSHSALATPELGRQFLDAAAGAFAKDFDRFRRERRNTAH